MFLIRAADGLDAAGVRASTRLLESLCNPASSSSLMKTCLAGSLPFSSPVPLLNHSRHTAASVTTAMWMVRREREREGGSSEAISLERRVLTQADMLILFLAFWHWASRCCYSSPSSLLRCLWCLVEVGGGGWVWVIVFVPRGSDLDMDQLSP